MISNRSIRPTILRRRGGSSAHKCVSAAAKVLAFAGTIGLIYVVSWFYLNVVFGVLTGKWDSEIQQVAAGNERSHEGRNEGREAPTMAPARRPPPGGEYLPCRSKDFPTKPEVPLFIKWEHFLPSARNLYFVQLGANVGRNVGSGDPVWEYVRPCSWSGAVVEPDPTAFAELEINYRDLEATGRVTTMHLGVSDTHGYTKMLGGGETARLSLTETVAKRGQLNNVTDDNVVVMVTLSQIWNRLRLRSRIPPTGVDILVLDVEGNEANILAHEELPEPRPIWILFEIADLSQEARHEIDEKLISQGYRQSADLIHMDEYSIRNKLPAQDRLYKLVG